MDERIRRRHRIPAPILTCLAMLVGLAFGLSSNSPTSSPYPFEDRNMFCDGSHAA